MTPLLKLIFACSDENPTDLPFLQALRLNYFFKQTFIPADIIWYHLIPSILEYIQK